MKKNQSMKLLVTVLILMMSLAGCSTNALLDYKNATQKTDDITRGKMSLSIKIENSFNTQGLSEETISNLKNFEKIEMSMISSFDNDQTKSVNDVYLNQGGMGLDTMIYSVEDFAYIKLPMINGYIKIDLNGLEMTPSIDTSGTESLIKRITKEWTELLETENVVKGEKSIMPTADGEVKVTIFTVSPTEDQLRLFLKKTISILRSEKDALEKFLQLANTDDNLDFDTLINGVEVEIEEMEKITFNTVAFIDIDGYIVKESIEIYFENYDPKPGQVSKRTVVISQENWDNEMEQNIVIPDISSDDLLDMNEAEGLFNNFR
ncbi:MAG: Uncharacterized protein XD91_0709 [Clostridiales bacterium 38_11]|nr:MAG: Uncharacterized protein XD91_0709 [Clostridiales bacterium 38_11]HBH13185.1 hypothetical protein [Clostridiales bacterium]